MEDFAPKIDERDCLSLNMRHLPGYYMNQPVQERYLPQSVIHCNRSTITQKESHVGDD